LSIAGVAHAQPPVAEHAEYQGEKFEGCFTSVAMIESEWTMPKSAPLPGLRTQSIGATGANPANSIAAQQSVYPRHWAHY